MTTWIHPDDVELETPRETWMSIMHDEAMRDLEADRKCWELEQAEEEAAWAAAGYPGWTCTCAHCLTYGACVCVERQPGQDDPFGDIAYLPDLTENS